MRLVVERAEGLRNVDIFSKSDPFVQGLFSFVPNLIFPVSIDIFFLVVLPGSTEKVQTTTKDNNLNPEWNEEFLVYVYAFPSSFSPSPSSSSLLFRTKHGGQVSFLLYDEETIKHQGEFLGECNYLWNNPTPFERIRQSSVCFSLCYSCFYFFAYFSSFSLSRMSFTKGKNLVAYFSLFNGFPFFLSPNPFLKMFLNKPRFLKKQK